MAQERIDHYVAHKMDALRGDALRFQIGLCRTLRREEVIRD